MNIDLLNGLLHCETDVVGALRRFCDDETLYITCLRDFCDDPTVEELDRTITEQAWDDAFTAAHALKGLVGNMGFVPLFHSTGELVLLIRAGKIGQVSASMRQLHKNYDEVISVIKAHLDTNSSVGGK